MYYSTSFGPFCTSFFCHRSNWNLPVNTLQGISGIVTNITSACHGAKPTSLCYFIDMITPFGCQIIFVSFFLWIAYSELPAFLVKEGGLNSGKHFVSLLPPMAFCFHIFPSALLWQITETVFLLCLILDGYFSRSPFLQVSWWRTVLRRLWVRLMIYTCLFHLLTLSFSSPEKIISTSLRGDHNQYNPKNCACVCKQVTQWCSENLGFQNLNFLKLQFTRNWKKINKRITQPNPLKKFSWK